MGTSMRLTHYNKSIISNSTHPRNTNQQRDRSMRNCLNNTRMLCNRLDSWENNNHNHNNYKAVRRHPRIGVWWYPLSIRSSIDSCRAWEISKKMPTHLRRNSKIIESSTSDKRRFWRNLRAALAMQSTQQEQEHRMLSRTMLRRVQGRLIIIWIHLHSRFSSRERAQWDILIRNR